MDDAFIMLTAGVTSLILACAPGTRPHILHWGARLAGTEPESLVRMTGRQRVWGGPDVELEASLLNETGAGLAGITGFAAHRAGQDWASVFRVQSVLRDGPFRVRLDCRDDVTKIGVVHDIAMDAESGLLTFASEVSNHGEASLSVDHVAPVCLPLDPRLTELLGFAGKWAGEFRTERIPAFTGTYLRENAKGRPGHDGFPGLIALGQDTTETRGECCGFHLGWSGNSRIRADRLSDGRAFVQMSELFFPGEVTLQPGERWRTPVLHAAWSGTGLSALSKAFHHHVRTSVLDGRIKAKPRPVHYNTWEAVYFDHDMDRLKVLAEAAAEVGAERFVLDDGWFGGRRNDKAGLGDWQVSPDVHPDGLGPLISHIRALGMEFGIWVEPEMVNPDSDLFRAHPDWVLAADGRDQIPFRGQLVLDLTREEVFANVFGQIDALLAGHDISYVKWDMNRDIHHPGSFGRAAGSAQVRAVYRLIDRLRAAHPGVEFETCSSGCGRADYGILARTDRIWTSDSNDALDRQTIQRGASHFFPPEVLGAHVGPETCHITGRRLAMDLRVATALFGHIGLEVNLLKETPAALETLKAGIALYKTHRALLHAGDFRRLDGPRHANAVAVVSPDRGEALYSWCNLAGHEATLPGRLYFAGLDPALSYRVRVVWPRPVRSRTSPSVIERAGLDGEGAVFTGEALIVAGLQLPLSDPETCLVFHLAATGIDVA